MNNLNFLETQKIILKLHDEIESKTHELLTAVEEKSLKKLKKIAPYFRDVDIYEMIADKLNVMVIKKEDFEFISYLIDSNSFSLQMNDKKWIQELVLNCATKDTELFLLVNKKYPDEMKEFLDNKINENGLVFCSVEVFDYYMEKNPTTLSTKELRIYIEEDRPDLLKRVLAMPENSRFFTEERSQVLIGLATGTKSWRSLEVLTDIFKVKKNAILIFNTDRKAENFFKNLNKNFDYNFFNNYKIDLKSLMHCIYHMRHLKNKENCKEFIDILVKKNMDDIDFIEQIKRKIDISTDEELKTIASSQFKLSYLNYKLKNDNSETKKKYRI